MIGTGQPTLPHAKIGPHNEHELAFLLIPRKGLELAKILQILILVLVVARGLRIKIIVAGFSLVTAAAKTRASR